MNNMLTRAISGAVFVSLLVFSILYSPQTFLGLFYICMLIAIFEFSRMLKLKNIWVYVLATLLYVSNCIELSKLNVLLADSTFVLIVLLLFVKQLFSKNTNAVKELGNVGLTVLYASLPFIFIAKIPFLNLTASYDNFVILGLFILIWSNDTFAYLVGKSIGKHKLLERISPKKTIEGFFGGMISTLIIAYLLSLQFNTLSTMQWMVVGLLVSIFGVLGDLIASMFKRQTGVKDTGNIIPGHGGIIDRLDSIIFASPFIYIYLKFISENVS